MIGKVYIDLNEGEYQYCYDNGVQTIRRNGVDWRDETWDNFILAMAQRIEDLTELLDDAVDVIDTVAGKNPTSCDSRLTDFLEEYEERKILS